MGRITRRRFVAAAAAAGLNAQGAGRIVVVGDVHGDLDRFVDVLSMARLVDDRLRWSGGDAQLVQLGNVTGRGSKSPRVIELLMRLEREAGKARGRLWCLIGSNEAMRLQGDLDGVSAAEYEAFRTKKSEQERERYFQRELAASQSEGEARRRADLALGYRQRWEKEHPLGQAELLRAFSAAGEYGAWVLRQHAALKLGETLFVHAGISARYAEWSERRLNDRVREELAAPASSSAEENVARDPLGPLWYRGLAHDSEESLPALIRQILARHSVQRIVVGHTPPRTGIQSRLGGKVILADAGLSQYFGARRACVVLERGRAFMLDRGVLTPLG